MSKEKLTGSTQDGAKENQAEMTQDGEAKEAEAAAADQKESKEAAKKSQKKSAGGKGPGKGGKNQSGEENAKVVTRYDRRMEKRRIEAEKERKSWLRFKIVCALICVAIVAAIVATFGIRAYKKYDAVNNTYVMIGDYEVTRVEFEYYFYTAYSNYVNSYGSYVYLFGLDTSSPLDEQEYADGLTWADYFDSSAVYQLKETKALYDAGQEDGFEYDASDDLEAFKEEMEEGAESYSVTTDVYYTYCYGDYATEELILPIVEENYYADAYYEQLSEELAASDEEIEAYYEEYQYIYDTYDFRRFDFELEETDDDEEELTDEELAAAIEEFVTQAEEMVERRLAGEDFEELCVEYANEDNVDEYGGEEEGSLWEDAGYYSVPSVAMEWVFDSERVEGDIEIFEDEDCVYVIEYIAVNNDWDTTYESIAELLAEESVSDYVEEIMENYPITDVKGEMAYLDYVAAQEEEEAEEEAEEETEEETSEEEEDVSEETSDEEAAEE